MSVQVFLPSSVPEVSTSYSIFSAGNSGSNAQRLAKGGRTKHAMLTSERTNTSGRTLPSTVRVHGGRRAQNDPGA